MKEIKELTEQVGLPVCLNDDGESPEGDTCFVIAKDGFYKLFKSGDIRVIQKMDKLPGGVKTLSEGVQWTGPKLPADLLDFICNIFIDFYVKTGNELNMHIWHSPTTGFWLNVPFQEVTPTASDWDDDLGVKWIHDYAYVDEGPSDGRRIGNVHSHHTMPPEWSSKDKFFQEKIEFGIQLVVGMINRGRGVCSRILFNGMAVDVPLEDVVDFGERRTLDIPDSCIGKLEPPGKEVKDANGAAKAWPCVKDKHRKKHYQPVSSYDYDAIADSPFYGLDGGAYGL